MLGSHMLALERGSGNVSCRKKGALTVGKKPRVNTLSRLVFPQAPSPMMTSFLGSQTCQWGCIGEARGAECWASRMVGGAAPRGASQEDGSARYSLGGTGLLAYLRMTFWAVRSFAMAGNRTGERRFAQGPVVVRSRSRESGDNGWKGGGS